MRILQKLSMVVAVALLGLLAACVTPARDGEFTNLFDGKTMNGWTLVAKHGDGYGVKDGILYCAKGGGGNLFTDKEYSDFILQFEFKMEAGGNNGIGIRSPLEGTSAYVGMEIQILDDGAPQYAKLNPAQYHGSVYDIVPARRGALKPVGQWNYEEIVARGRHIKVTLNGTVIVDTNLNDVVDPAVLAKHPGMLRDRGHIGLLGHTEYTEFRNIRIKELPVARVDNKPPEGFTALFNGRDLTGWQGLVATPPKRAKMSIQEWATAQVKADEKMAAHWHPQDGVLVFDGKGDNLCTAKNYADFELLVDWKIMEKGDSGIYLRGSPQVQIWDRDDTRGNPKRVGSGGLYNNQKNPSEPLVLADHIVGEWNRFRILMVGEKVTVYLNNELVTHNVTLENYWERDRPIYPSGAIELQNHGNTLYFKNVFVREITPRSAK
jgi:hypothetical protein